MFAAFRICQYKVLSEMKAMTRSAKTRGACDLPAIEGDAAAETEE